MEAFWRTAARRRAENWCCRPSLAVFTGTFERRARSWTPYGLTQSSRSVPHREARKYLCNTSVFPFPRLVYFTARLSMTCSRLILIHSTQRDVRSGLLPPFSTNNNTQSRSPTIAYTTDHEHRCLFPPGIEFTSKWVERGGLTLGEWKAQHCVKKRRLGSGNPAS